MALSDMEEIASTIERAIPGIFDRVTVDAFVVMPDHIYGLAVIKYSTSAHNRRFQPDDFRMFIAENRAVVQGPVRSRLPPRTPAIVREIPLPDRIIRDRTELERMRR
jgi:hypothetical protein